MPTSRRCQPAGRRQAGDADEVDGLCRWTVDVADGRSRVGTPVAGMAIEHGASGATAISSGTSTLASRLVTNCWSSLVDTSASTPAAELCHLARDGEVRHHADPGTRFRRHHGGDDLSGRVPCPASRAPPACEHGPVTDFVELGELCRTWYEAVIGPTLTFTTPRISSPSTSRSSAPGRHGAIRSTSVRTARRPGTGTATSNSFVSSIG